MILVIFKARERGGDHKRTGSLIEKTKVSHCEIEFFFKKYPFSFHTQETLSLKHTKPRHHITYMCKSDLKHGIYTINSG